MGEFRHVFDVSQGTVEGASELYYRKMIRGHIERAIDLTIEAGPGFCDYTGQMLCAALEEYIGAGPAGQAQIADMKYDAAWWADMANPRELEAYVGAGLRAIERRTFAPAARKRLLVALWDSLDTDEKRAFLTRVDPEGRFVRGAA